MRLKSRKAESEQRVKVSLAKYAGKLRHDCEDLFSQTQKPSIFRISKNQIIVSTPSRYLNFSFSVEVFPT